jgi:hypothetical protein
MATSSFGIGGSGDQTSQWDSIAREKKLAEDNRIAKLAEGKAAEKYFMGNNGGQLNTYMSPDDQGELNTRNQALSDINMLYGESPMQTGRDAKNYSNIVRDSVNQNSLKADLMRKTSMNDLYRGNAKAGLSGVDTTGASSNLSRRANYEADAYNQEYKDKNLDRYGKNVGSRLSGQYGVITGKDAQAIANIAPSVPAQSKGMFGSIICTELFKQGKINKEEYRACSAYGIRVKPEIYAGYLVVARPLVFLMKKSDLFSNLFVNWAKNIQTHWATRIFSPVCNIIGQRALSAKYKVEYGKN